MKNIVIVGCGKGIGLAAAKILAEQHKIIGISKTENAEINQLNIEFYPLDILSGNLDDINFPETIDGLIYAPGSINLKPINRLTEDDFRNDFEINVIGAVKIIKKIYIVKKDKLSPKSK